MLEFRKMRKTIIIFALAMGAMSMIADNDARISRNMDIFNMAFKELATFYVDSLDSDKAVETALNSMMAELDPYTEYIPARDMDDFKSFATGEYGGVGSYIMERDGYVYFTEPYENSPAARAGIRSGDKVIAINGESMAGKSNDQVSNLLKGQPGTSLQLRVVRPYCGADSVKEFTIVRESIKLNSVTYHGMAADGVGYIKLESFNDNCGKEFRDALLDLKNNQKLRSLIIDLRGNTGGLVDGAIQILGLFLPKGTEVLQTRGKDASSRKTYRTTATPIDTKLPLAVLIDGSSASASEIVAGALQDLDRAVVLGSRSFGKGLVQVTRPLPYDGIIKLTTAKYYIPSGRLIQEVDYSNKGADGKVKAKSDTVGNVFKTAHGREVRDGGGITPDIKIDYPEVNRLVYNIVRDNWAFDFSTKYAATHPSIEPVENFEITDEIYNDFKASIDPARFDYDKVCEKGLADLRKVAEVEGYMNDETREQFDRLATLLRHDLNRDLDTQRPEISKLLAQEIIKNYYYQKGQVVYALKHDVAIERSVAVLNNSAEYHKLLNTK